MVRFAWVVATLLLTACASAPPETPASPSPPSGPVTYLPPVVVVTLVTAAGLRETRPDWSDQAEINLINALRDAVSDSRIDVSHVARTEARTRAERIPELAQEVPTSPHGQTLATAPLRAVILVEYDVESSASRLVQGGLGLVFGGVPGPDGMTRRARLALFDAESGAAVWWHEEDAPDPREPKAARRMIEHLLDAIGEDTGS